MFKNTFLIIYFIRLQIPLVLGATEEEQIVTYVTTPEVPEYREWVRKQKLESVKKKESGEEVVKMEGNKNEVASSAELLLASPIHLPSISLCKDAAAANQNLYSSIYCGALLALYFMAIISLIIYQLKALISLKLAPIFNKNRDRGGDNYGQFPNRSSDEIELKNPNPLARLLSK